MPPSRKRTIKKKKAPKKVSRKATPKKKAPLKVAKPEKPVGEVKHFYTQIKVAIVRFKVPVKVGAVLRFEGATTKFTDKIGSMQFDHKSIKIAPKGKLVGLRVKKRVREGDRVFREG